MSARPPHPLSDAELLEAWRGGRATAGQELFKRHYDVIERFLLNKAGADRVVDLVQETFVACVESRDQIRDGDRFRSYLLSIAYHAFCRDLGKRYRDGCSIDTDTISLTDLEPRPSSLIARAREQRLLLEGLRSIPLKYQTVLELHYWEQLSTREIAAVLEMPSGTVRGQLQRARAALEATMASISRSPEVLDSTLTRLDDWAARCGRELLEMPRAS